jgi:hypothetical protein
MHYKTWYADTCDMNGHGLTIQTVYYGQMCVLYEGFGSIGFVTMVQLFPMVWLLYDGRH